MNGLNGQLPKRHRDPRAAEFACSLRAYSANTRRLLGIQDEASVACLTRQLLDSVRRVEFVRLLGAKRYSNVVADPSSALFDPLKAAVVRLQQGNSDDAVWLVFLGVHFGKHPKDGWLLARYVYGRGGEEGLWDWASVVADLPGFRGWLETHQDSLKRFRFSNHRKYESVSGTSANGTGNVVRTFVDWITTAGSLNALVRDAHRRVGQNPTEVFDALYRGMAAVQRFGRLAKFDFLTHLGKLGIAPITPGSAYIWDGATGPYLGIRLLVTGQLDGALTRREADHIYIELGDAIGVGMQELEDALCNWQKSPTEYRYFRG
jgi:hypothetical protein